MPQPFYRLKMLKAEGTMETTLYSIGLGGLISALLSITAYFLHYLHRDFREVQAHMIQLRADLEIVKVDLERVLRAFGLGGTASRYLKGD